MTKTTKKYILYISILVIVSALAVYFVLKQDPAAVFSALSRCDLKYIFIAIGMMIITYVLEAVILLILTRMYKRNYRIDKSFLNVMIGVFFSDITPSSSGGQFVQAYTFSKQGVKMTNAASILFMRFIIFQIALVLFSSVVFGFKFNELAAATSQINIFGWNFSIVALSIIGFIINVFVIVGLFFLAFSKRVHNVSIKYGIGLLAKLHIVKNKDERILKLNTKVETFRIEFKRLLQNWPVLLSTGFLFIIELIVLNCIPFFIARSMNLEFSNSNNVINFINTTSMTLLTSCITSMVPIPGASGGAELVFQFMFGGTFFTNATSGDISALILLWRGITFYLGLIIGFIVFVSYHESPKKESFLHGDSRTLLELQVINLDEHNNVILKNEIDKASSHHIEPQLLTVDDIESHFASLKNDLSKQLENNAKTLEKEEKKKISLSFFSKNKDKTKKKKTPKDKEGD